MSAISRRSFLKSSAVIAAGTAASRARANGANKRIRVAVIGCRNRGWQNALGFHRAGRFEVVAFADCDQKMYDIAMEKISKEIPYKPAYEQDFRRLLDNQSIDAIAVATPDHWHALQTVKALEAGKHVFVEKPASFNINDGKAMVAAQKKHPDLVVAVGTQQRSAAHFKDAKAFIDEGHLGQISFARAWLSGGRHRVEKVPNTEPPKHLDYDMWVGPAPKRPYNPEKLHYNWHFMRDYGTNDAGNWGAHWLDIVRWYADLDVPLAASSVGGKYVIHDEKEWFDTQTTLFEFPNLTVVWEMRHWTNTGVEGMGIGTELRGSKGTLLIDRGGWRFYPKGGEMVKHGGSVTDKPHTTNFADCIAGDAKPAASIEDGHKTAIMCHLANITTSFNRHVKFDPRTQTIVDDPQASAMEGREYRSQWQMPESVARAIS